MNKKQIIILLGGILIFGVLYFGFDKVPPKQKALEKSGALNVESTSLTNLIKDALPQLDNQKKSVIEAMNLDLNASDADTLKKIEILKSLSGTWYEFGFPEISGIYAEDIAKMDKSAESWSITGTTFALCVKNNEKENVRDFCSKRAVKAFENAISIQPDVVEHRINLAICYVDNPLQDNPMQGILMLRDLSEKYPENVSVLNQLARLALQTNQIEKAIQRLESAIAIEPENKNTICLLATAYKSAGDARAQEFEEKCIQ
jgi:tetratricopeptide (TPR) repeat protein